MDQVPAATLQQRGPIRWVWLALSAASTALLIVLAYNLGQWREGWAQAPEPERAVTKLVCSSVWQFGAPLAAVGALVWMVKARPPRRTWISVFAVITFAFWITYSGRTWH